MIPHHSNHFLCWSFLVDFWSLFSVSKSYLRKSDDAAFFISFALSLSNMFSLFFSSSFCRKMGFSVSYDDFCCDFFSFFLFLYVSSSWKMETWIFDIHSPYDQSFHCHISYFSYFDWIDLHSFCVAYLEVHLIFFDEAIRSSSFPRRGIQAELIDGYYSSCWLLCLIEYVPKLTHEGQCFILEDATNRYMQKFSI